MCAAAVLLLLLFLPAASEFTPNVCYLKLFLNKHYSSHFVRLTFVTNSPLFSVRSTITQSQISPLSCFEHCFYLFLLEMGTKALPPVRMSSLLLLVPC
jgi:hypothetical protein